ncbi:MAG: C25 family cysteine peptidase [Acidobacteriota bacterium]
MSVRSLLFLTFAVPALPAFRIETSHEAAYGVTFEQLAAHGLAPCPSAGLALTSQGKPVPIWISDGGDGTFGPGDRLEFVGDILHGTQSYLNDFAKRNVYILRADAVGGARMKPLAASAGPVAATTTLETRRHEEVDTLLLRFPGKDEKPQELWYWAKLSYLEPALEIELDLSDARLLPKDRLHMEIEMRGWSRPWEKEDPLAPDHQVVLSINGSRLVTARWNGGDPHTIVIDEPMDGRFHRNARNRLTISVPKRVLAGSTSPFVDVVLLNWIQLSYPCAGAVSGRVYRAGKGAVADIETSGPSLWVYGEDGSRIEDVAADTGQRSYVHRIPWPAGDGVFVASGDLPAPDAIAPFDSHPIPDVMRADYIMVVHASLVDAIAPLADFYRKRGLGVAVVRVDQIYDQFGDGICSPDAIRRFLTHAYHQWTPPRPRFVLLVGDASWDSKNDEVDDTNYAKWDSPVREAAGESFNKGKAAPYEGGSVANNRNLVPSFTYEGTQGHAASDNAFVCVDGDDYLPDMAIGRFPVVAPGDVAAIVEKTIRFVENPPVGDWRHRLLFIADDNPGFQKISRDLGRDLTPRGFEHLEVFPAEGPVTDAHRPRLRQAFDSGQLVVQFVGHGGRFIWRTGPADLKGQRDLFTLEDVDMLRPTTQLPVVLSFSCYSAPFDHPNADSIGEKLLRVPGRGAVAFVGASWRINPSMELARAFLDGLTRPGTIGEAVMNAKRLIPDNRALVEMYTLLGDPAVPNGVPATPVDVAASEGGKSVHVTVGQPAFTGRATVEWIDAEDAVLHREELEASSPRLDAAWPDGASAHAVRVHVWSDRPGVDGVGGVLLDGAPVAGTAASPR